MQFFSVSDEVVSLPKGAWAKSHRINVCWQGRHKAGWNDFITLEVSARVWSKEGYCPVQAASLSYATLNKAFKIAGVTRT